MKIRLYVAITASLLAVTALIHLLRMMLGWLVQVGAADVPMWVSGIVMLLTAAGAAWGFLLLRRAGWLRPGAP